MPMDELLARQMPHSLEAEQAALGLCSSTPTASRT